MFLNSILKYNLFLKPEVQFAIEFLDLKCSCFNIKKKKLDRSLYF